MANCGARRGRGWMCFLPYLLFGVLVLCGVSVEGHGGNIQDGETCVPWMCSCFYNGVYYDKGDVWRSQDDPCLSFQCIENGVFKPVKSGCSFKGYCHDANSTWMEGCFRYRCHADYRSSFYRLDQAACVWKDGNCYSVGQQATERCDVYECQIDGGCYVMNKVKSACQIEDSNKPCMPLFSFWQDECAIYQCLGEDKDHLRARVLTHSHDVMMWPRGHYALPEPKIKCPDLGEPFWMEGSYTQCGDGCNYKSQVFNLLGDYNETSFDHHFCVHHDVDDPTVIPLYQTYWEPGRYCILRYNGTCPKGFSEGFVEMTNNICNATNITMGNSTFGNITTGDKEFGNFTTGVLPDGNFTENVTRMEFCCRYDGEIDRPIILPAKHPFVLFMAENETECQTVQGMNHEIEFWSFCDTDDGVYRELNGSLPLIKTGDNNTLINYCYYTPIGCGCTDDDETVVALGDIVERDCVKRECKNVFKYNLMVIKEGGCMDNVNEMCRIEGETWTDLVGEMCVDRKCNRTTDEDDHIIFEIVDVSKGCRDGNHCVALNYTKVNGCYHTQCQLDNTTGESSFVVTLAGCSDGHGKCIPDGSNFTQSCIQMRCDKSRSSCGLSIIKGACSYKGVCYDVGAIFKHYCTEYVCKEYKKSTSVSYNFAKVKEACSDAAGNCYDIGQRVKTPCGEYECISGKSATFVAVWAGCKVSIGDGCVEPDEKLEYYCNTYNCTVYEDGSRKLLKEKSGCSYNKTCYDAGSLIRDSKGCVISRCSEAGGHDMESAECSVNGKCYPGNQDFKIGCSTYHCKVNGTHKSVVHKSVECGFNGTCYPGNQDFMIGCSTYHCKVNGTHRSVVHKSIACKVGDKCIPPGQKYKLGCHTYQCSQDEKSCSSHLVEYGCKDPDTNECVDPGDTIKQGCSEFECKPNGTSNPFHFKSKDCSYGGKCFGLDETIPYGACEDLLCTMRDGNLVMMRKHAGCTSADGECIRVTEGESKDFIYNHEGKRCDARCSRVDGNLKIALLSCQSK